MVCDKVDENISCYYGIYAEIVKVIGADKMKAFYEIVKGQQIVFPIKLYSKEYMVAIAQSGKRSMKELAREFGYSGTLFSKNGYKSMTTTRKINEGKISNIVI